MSNKSRLDKIVEEVLNEAARDFAADMKTYKAEARGR